MAQKGLNSFLLSILWQKMTFIVRLKPIVCLGSVGEQIESWAGAKEGRGGV
ncbi:MAG: hypothetical protein H6633_31685 [Anaerolineales bacterium]|nr:hypothetical protein [Anaerolineales bacterium]